VTYSNTIQWNGRGGVGSALLLLLSACGPAPADIENIMADINAASSNGAQDENARLAGRLSAVGLTCAQVVKTQPYERNDTEVLVTCLEDARESKQVRYVYNAAKGTARLPEADRAKK